MTDARKNKIHSGTKVRARGRPRTFDIDAALSAATDVFKKKGYAAATLDGLSDAMSVNRPSLYAAFQSKEALYRRALQEYAQGMGFRFEQALSEPGFAKALRRLYATALDAYYAEDGEPLGCMVACTAVTEAPGNEALRADTKSILDVIDQLVAKRIERAIADGELTRTVRPKALSRLVVAMLHSLAMRARAGTSRRILDEMAADAVAMLTRQGEAR